MTTLAKRYTFISGTLLVVAAIGCLFGAMQRRSWAVPKGERIEVRSYGTFIFPDTGDSPIGHIKMLRWRFQNPGHARILAAMARAERKSPKGLRSPQQVFEELGIEFPSGCYARAGVGGSVDIAHYPSILAEIEQRLSLPVLRRNVLVKAPGRAEQVDPPNERR